MRGSYYQKREDDLKNSSRGGGGGQEGMEPRFHEPSGWSTHLARVQCGHHTQGSAPPICHPSSVPVPTPRLNWAAYGGSDGM